MAIEICYVNGLAYAFNCVKSALTYRLHRAGLIDVKKYDTQLAITSTRRLIPTAVTRSFFRGLKRKDRKKFWRSHRDGLLDC
jgi:hypothetical protein